MSFASFGVGFGSLMQGLGQGLEMGDKLNGIRDQKAVRESYKEGLSNAKAKRAEDVSKAVKVGSKANADNTMTLPDYQVDGKSYADEASAQGAADKSVASVMDYFYQNEAPRIAQLYMEQGDPQKAQVWEQWVTDKNNKKGFEYGVAALRSAQSGDDEGAVNQMLKMYNHPSYFEDGRKATGVTPVKNDQGETTGYDIAIEAADGSTTSLSVGTGEQLLKQIQQFANPQAVYDQGWADVNAARAAKLEAAQGELKHGRDLEVAQVKANNAADLAQQKGSMQLQNGIALENAKHGNRVNLEAMKAQAGLMWKKGAAPQEAFRQIVTNLQKQAVDFQGRPTMSLQEIAAQARELVEMTYTPEQLRASPIGGDQPQQPQQPGGKGVPVMDMQTGKIVYR